MHSLLENRRLLVDLDLELAVLAHLLLDDGAAELAVDQLHAVADSQNGDAQSKYFAVVGRGVVGVHGLGAAGDNDAAVAILLKDTQIDTLICGCRFQNATPSVLMQPCPDLKIHLNYLGWVKYVSFSCSSSS